MILEIFWWSKFWLLRSSRSKFPVSQHLPFGSLFSWDQDPNATAAAPSAHAASQPIGSSRAPATQIPQGTTRAPWADAPKRAGDSTMAPWAQARSTHPNSGMPLMQAPWEAGRSGPSTTRSEVASGLPPTKAPWANQRGTGGGWMFQTVVDNIS
jgi:serine/threonine-protein phosphatase 2A activator